jgi:3-oxoacyl-[acyl-carrier protein] reductase
MDFFLELSRNPTSRSIIERLGLPLPQPPVLRRARGPLTDRIFDDASVVVHAAQGSTLLPAIQGTLAAAGARVVYDGPSEGAEGFRPPAEAYGEPFAVRSEPGERERVHALVLDVSGLDSVDALSDLHRSSVPWLRALDRSARIVLLTRPNQPGLSPNLAAARQAVEGFARSLAKELGRKGTTVNLLRVAEGAEDRVNGPLRFLLSKRSAFITGQPIDVTVRTRANARAPHQSPLFGKRALVTGAARGIGASTARALAREGAHVIIVDRPDADADASRLAQELGGTPLLVDIAAADAATRFAEHLRKLGGVDILVHNAGITRDKTLSRMSAEQWELVLDVNLRAAVRVTEHLLGEGLVRDEGRLVFLASVTGLAGNVGQTNYAASKAGLIGYARALAETLAPRGITANAIAPGLIETQMTGHMPVAIREAARRLSALNQGGLPEDVAEAVTFLALPNSDGVSGSVLRVCGGALVGA